MMPRLKAVRSTLVAGLVVVLPVGMTLGLIWTFAGWVDEIGLRYLPPALRSERVAGGELDGTGIGLFFVVTLAVGWLAKFRGTRWVLRTAEGLVSRAPIVRSVYSGTKQIAEALTSQTGGIERVCLLEYPCPGKWVLGFVTSRAQDRVGAALGQTAMCSVFVPTAPNPVTGLLHFVPRSRIIELDMSIEEGLKLIVSAGLIRP